MHELKINTTKLIKGLLLITLMLVVAHVTLQYLYHIHDIEILSTLRGRLDVDNEISVPTWFSQILLLIPAGLSFLLFALGRRKTQPNDMYWALFGGLFIFLSADEGAMLHEAFITKFREWTAADASGIGRHTWLIPVALALVLITIPFWRFAKSLPRRTVLLLSGGLVTYVFGAVVYETIGLVFVKGDFAYQGLNVALEEALEMAGAIIVTYSLLDYLRTQAGSIKFKLL